MIEGTPPPAVDLDSHPAVIAWRMLEPGRPPPEQIVALKGDCVRHRSKKSAVYRLSRTGRHGFAMIAKRCRKHTAALERMIYTEILPQFPVPTLRFLGEIEDTERRNSWLFLEDAGDEVCSKADPRHRHLAAEWLAMLHGCHVPDEVATQLPDRGPNHYLGKLRSNHESIRQSIPLPSLSIDDCRTLEQLLLLFDVLEVRWGQIMRFCDEMPRVMVHGDFVDKNVRVRSQGAGPVLLAYDWECAGWGIPAVDLQQDTSRSLAPDLADYFAAARHFWPGRWHDRIELIAALGFTFRLISGIGWACDSLHSGQSSSGLAKPISLLRRYQDSLQRALQDLDRASHSSPGFS